MQMLVALYYWLKKGRHLLVVNRVLDDVIHNVSTGTPWRGWAKFWSGNPPGQWP